MCLCAQKLGTIVFVLKIKIHNKNILFYLNVFFYYLPNKYHKYVLKVLSLKNCSKLNKMHKIICKYNLVSLLVLCWDMNQCKRKRKLTVCYFFSRFILILSYNWNNPIYTAVIVCMFIHGQSHLHHKNLYRLHSQTVLLFLSTLSQHTPCSKLT